MERLVRANALDRDNLRAVDLSGKEQTGAHRPAVEHHRTSPAYAMLAPDMGSHQAEIVAQKIHQRAARFNRPVSLASYSSTRSPSVRWRYALPSHAPAPPARARGPRPRASGPR